MVLVLPVPAGPVGIPAAIALHGRTATILPGTANRPPRPEPRIRENRAADCWAPDAHETGNDQATS